jgi:hypothetical protein
MDSYDIRFWDIKKTGIGSAARCRVRWAVDGREHCKSFKTRPLANGFLGVPTDGHGRATRGHGSCLTRAFESGVHPFYVIPPT